MIYIRSESQFEHAPDPEALFRERHINNADILDNICKVGPGETFEQIERRVRQMNLIMISTYGTAIDMFEGEFDKEIVGIGTLRVRFYGTGYMDLTLTRISH